MRIAGQHKRVCVCGSRVRACLSGDLAPPQRLRALAHALLVRSSGYARSRVCMHALRVLCSTCAKPASPAPCGPGSPGSILRPAAGQMIYFFFFGPQRRAVAGRGTTSTSRPRLRLSTLTGIAWERAEGGRWQRLCASTPQLRRSTFLQSPGRGRRAVAGRGTAPQHHGYVSQP